MHRRRFLQQGARALAVAPFIRGLAGAQSIPPAALDRIGITTVCFRERFPATRSKGAPAPAGEDLTLLTAPKLIADHSLDYCRQVKAAAAAAGSRIIDIQVDGPENLSDPDPAKRAASIAAIKQWMDRAAAV